MIKGKRDKNVDQYLKPTAYVDSDAANILAFAERVAGGAAEPVGRAVALYHAVRDEIVYTPYCDFRSVETYRASACLARGSGFCVAKSAVLAAAARAVGVPARLGFADVRNHLASPRLRRLMGTDVFYYHGYAELYLDGAWVKATPVFDRGLCDRFGVLPLPFDGRRDSLFQAYDPSGRRHMEYVRDRGPSADVPVEAIIETFERHYPALLVRATGGPAERFRDEAAPMAEPPGS
jgi:transglutaminase-like putative cysteine protease